jgi:hypothetical protein
MSRAEVEAILGPPGDYRSGPVLIDWPGKRSGGPGMDEEEVTDLRTRLMSTFGARRYLLSWRTDRYVCDVTFNPASKVISKDSWEATRVEQGPLDNLRWRVKRQLRRWFP